jgi:hypothetical protein
MNASWYYFNPYNILRACDLTCNLLWLLYTGCVVLFWYSGAGEPTVATGPNHKSGIMAVAATFLAFSALQGPNSVMVRPHPVVWRLVYGLAILYLLSLVFLLFQGKDEARRLLKVWNESTYQ